MRAEDGGGTKYEKQGSMVRVSARTLNLIQAVKFQEGKSRLPDVRKMLAVKTLPKVVKAEL